MAQFRFTRDKQCERCGELDDGACVCTQAVVRPLPQPEPAERAVRRTVAFVSRHDWTWWQER